MNRFGSYPRKGSITPFLLVALTLFLAAFALAFNLSAVREAKQELRTVADAAALAATNELAHDDFLKQDASLVPAIFQQAALSAQTIAARNTFRGQPFPLEISSVSGPNDQVVFGYLTTPRQGTFTVIAPTDSGNSFYFQTNAVRVVLDRSRANGNAFRLAFANITGQPEVDLPLHSTAMIDRAVIGFRPITRQPLPLAPLALLSDPTAVNIRSWENRVEHQNGPDQYRFDRTTKTFSAGADQLHEMPIELALTAGQLPTANVALLTIGSNGPNDFNAQVQRGITPEEMQAVGGQIVLDVQQQTLLPGTLLGPSNTTDAQALQQALTDLHHRGEARVWPLYIGLDGSGNIIVTGFVVARIAAVEPFAANQPLRFTLQPAQLVTASALTDQARQQNGTIRLNPYVGKVRLVD
jgi:Flp pilus assembly protein TadG